MFFSKLPTSSHPNGRKGSRVVWRQHPKLPGWWRVSKPCLERRRMGPPSDACWFLNHYNPIKYSYIYHKPLLNHLSYDFLYLKNSEFGARPSQPPDGSIFRHRWGKTSCSKSYQEIQGDTTFRKHKTAAQKTCNVRKILFQAVFPWAPKPYIFSNHSQLGAPTSTP